MCPGLLNLTGLLSANAYLTRPHHRATPPYAMTDIKVTQKPD
jgi:hypothetical protein